MQTFSILLNFLSIVHSVCSFPEYSEEANNKQKLNYVDLRDEIIARQVNKSYKIKMVLVNLNQ